MNRIYRIVWNRSSGSWQAASELARPSSKAGGAGRRNNARRVLTAGMAMTALSLNLIVPLAHADNLLVGAGGTGGGNGGNGSINGGNGGPAFYLAGGGGGGITGVTQTASSPANSSSLGPVYDNVVIGGGGGGGSGSGGITGGTGDTGTLNVDATTLNVGQALQIGGFGGGGGAGNNVSDRGGDGGAGGSGTLTATGGSTITVGNQLVIGGTGGGGGACGCSGNGGVGGAGILNLGDGSSLNLGSATFIINGNGVFNVGNATPNGATAGTITGFTGGIANNGTINFNQSNASYTFSMSSYGSGTVVQNGSGTTILTEANTYSGGTTINAGLIGFSNNGNLGSGNVTLNGGGLQWAAGNTTDISSRLNALGVNGGTFDTNGNNVTLASAISGTGGLTKAGSGILTLMGVSAYQGATIIDGGTLALTGAASIESSSGVTDNGTFDISGATGGASIRNLSGTGVAALGANTLTLTDASGIFNGTLTGTGSFVKQGSGLLILNGNSALFAGSTTISGGSLEVGDIDTPAALLGGNVRVASAGTLRGHGTVLGDVTNNGTVAPGGSIGTLNVGGNYVQASNATLAIEVSPTAASQLTVNGSATLNGVLAIAYDPGTYTTKSYTLLAATKGVSGTFGSITSTGTSYLGTLAPSVAYGADAVELTLSEAATAPATPPIVVAPSDTSIYTAVGTATILGAQAQDAALLDRLDQTSGATSTAPYGWITATGSHTNVGGTDGEPGFQSNRYGFLAGLEQKYGEYAAGVAVGYDHADIGESVTGDSGTTDTLRAALYGSRGMGPVNLGATLGVGLDFLSQKRPFGSFGTAGGDHTGQEFNIGGQASLPMLFGDVSVTPRIGLRYAYFHANGFGESGAGGQDLNVGTDNVRSLQPYVGVTIDRAFGDALKPVNAELRIGYAHELLDANRAVSVASQDGTVFAAPGTSLPRGYITVGAGVKLHPGKNLYVSLDYDTMINTTHMSAQQGSVHIGYRF